MTYIHMHVLLSFGLPSIVGAVDNVHVPNPPPHKPLTIQKNTTKNTPPKKNQAGAPTLTTFLPQKNTQTHVFKPQTHTPLTTQLRTHIYTHTHTNTNTHTKTTSGWSTSGAPGMAAPWPSSRWPSTSWCRHVPLSLSIYLYIYICIFKRVCLCVRCFFWGGDACAGRGASDLRHACTYMNVT